MGRKGEGGEGGFTLVDVRKVVTEAYDGFEDGRTGDLWLDEGQEETEPVSQLTGTGHPAP